MNDKSIFFEAVEIKDPEARSSFLEQACGADQKLRKEIENLIREHERSGEFLRVPVLEQLKDVDQTKNIVEGESGIHVQNSECDETLFPFLEPSHSEGSLGRLAHYEIQELIGRGGCGIVFKAFDERLHRIVAIKVMAPEFAVTSPARKRFLREARATASVRHENVVNIFAVEETPIPFLVMEYIDGKSLQQLINETGPLDLSSILRLGKMIADGLDAAHQKRIIHRDVKPANIIVESGTQQIKITDFGLARAVDDASQSQSGVIAGTPNFMSPEQARGLKVDIRSDLFSLGSVLYVMSSGRPPFRAQATLAVLKRVVDEEPRHLKEIIPELDDRLVRIVQRLHEKDPDKRYSTAKQVSDDLVACTLNQTNSDPPLAEQSRPVREKKSLKVAWISIFILSSLGVTEATGVTAFHGTVIRQIFPEGTLVVEVDDPDVKVSLDGNDLLITGIGVREFRVKPGKHQLLASKHGEVVQQNIVTISRNGKQIVRLSQEQLSPQVDETAKAPVVELSQHYSNSIGMEFVKVPAGGAYLGGSGELRGNQWIEFADDFYIGKYEVTQEQWLRLVQKNLSYFSTTGDGKFMLGDLAESVQKKLPVESVSVFDIKVFLGALNAECRDEGWSYRLPTEVEWEYACRGGPSHDMPIEGSDYYLDSPSSSLSNKQANISSQIRRTREVGAYSPNSLGIFDLHGNVQEWCLRTNPETGEPTSEYSLRGGSWQHLPRDCRAIDRKEQAPSQSSMITGFRLVRVPAEARSPQVRFQMPEEQRSALEWVVSHGGKLIVYVNGERISVYPGGQVPTGMLKIDTVDLKGMRLLDRDNVQALSQLPKVENAVFLDPAVDDDIFKMLMSFPGITNLANLDAHSTAISDDSLAQLKSIPRLYSLELSKTQVTAQGLKHLKELPNAGVLLKDCKQIDDEACEVLAAFPRWVWLGLSGTSVTDAGLEKLHRCQNLVAIDVVRCPVTEEGVKNLARALPKCRIEWDGGFIEAGSVREAE